jgi:hypothetical protein
MVREREARVSSMTTSKPCCLYVSLAALIIAIWNKGIDNIRPIPTKFRLVRVFFDLAKTFSKK